QWYSVQQGFRPYHTHRSKPQSGDWMVFPKQVSSQQLDPFLKLRVLNKIWKERSAFLPVSGSEFGGMYLSNFGKNPWTVSSVPYDTVIVAEVVENEVE
ncbi:MAG: hypothetical protein K2Q22_10165, partial [Cytophagales bacterium]|nr:hypothetical protein [Cytophagales bacterium]